MDALLILTYTAFCVAIFKIFKIPLNKWTVPTAVFATIVKAEHGGPSSRNARGGQRLFSGRSTMQTT